MNCDFYHQNGDTYLVTGLLYNSTIKFSNRYTVPEQALGINLWRGRVWQIRAGKRTLVKRVTN
jgi:hypothetical protein